MTDLAKIRARESDPLTMQFAQACSDAVFARIDKKAQKALAERAVKAAKPQSKVILLRELAAGIERATAGIVACKKGCNHCCKMDVLLPVQEARVIAAETGAYLADPKPSPLHVLKAERGEYSGIPCPFLTDAGCGIYKSRPLACRAHYVMDSDNTLCEIVPGEKIRAPHLNTGAFDMSVVNALSNGDPLSMHYADIRAFFPKGLAK